MAIEKYAALFRGINVGGRNTLPMKELVGILERAGARDVRTYIQSGNAVFRLDPDRAADLDREVGDAILAGRGFRPKILLRPISQLSRAAEDAPFVAAEGKALHFFFLASTPESPDLRALEELKSKTEEFALGTGVFYLHAPEGIGRSRLAERVERALGVPATARNWNTVRKILALAEQL